MVAPLRIAHVSATFPPYHAGTGNVCYRNAVELARRGHSVHVFTAYFAGTIPEETHQGVMIHRLKPLIRVGNAPLIPQLGFHLRGFDIIHLHYPFFGGEITALAACLTRIPLLITYHQDVHRKGLIGGVERLLRNSTSKACLRSAKCLLFTSKDYGQSSYIRPFLVGRENRIGELPNGVDVQAFTPGDKQEVLLHRLSIDPSDSVVLLVASLDIAHYFKGVDIFLESLLELPAKVKGVIIGDGDLRPVYEKKAAKLGLEKRIIFSGRVSNSELPDYYRLADVTVLPSVTMGEAFGLVLLESMACGTPVVASSLPGVRTVVDDGVDGYLVQPGDVQDLGSKLRQILSLPNSIKVEMGRAGRRKVEQRYTWELIGARLEQIYLDTLAKSPARKRSIGNGEW